MVRISFWFMLMMLICTCILGGSERTHNIKKSSEALVVASKETGIVASADKTKYTIMSQEQIAAKVTI
jgi:hypothetical protein